MTKNWINWINLGLAGISILLIISALFLFVSRPSEIPIVEISQEKPQLPQGAFSMDKEDYDAIGSPFMHLNFSPLTLQLPNLRPHIVYYGRNERPDASEEQSMLHFSFAGLKDYESVPPEKPLYLIYDKDQPRASYRFSPDNAETSLWIIGSVEGEEAAIQVFMKNEAGEIIRKPAQYSEFKLKQRRFSRAGIGDKWELGKWKVDGTLLARQKARWYGQDLFLESHGGDEYKGSIGKSRIDFGEGEDRYSVFIGPGETLAWINDRWIEVPPNEDSRQYPLLVVKKVDERLMKLELWDVGGRSKNSLNLIKSRARGSRQRIEDMFKFVGARTRSQLTFEVDGERMLISPKDWILFIDGRWVKLTTPEEIDDYVERRADGPLLVVEGIIREGNRQVLKATLFNESRTESTEIEIPLQQSGTGIRPDRPSKIKDAQKKPKKTGSKNGKIREVPEIERRLRENYKVPEDFKDRLEGIEDLRIKGIGP